MPKRYANKLKEPLAESPVPAEGKTLKAETVSAPPKKNGGLRASFARFKEKMDQWKVVQLTGLFLVVLSICMLVAFVSYLFTWQQDYDKVTGSFSPLLSTSVKTANWLGNFGAKLSKVFIYNWFGVAAFGFVLLSFIAGVKMFLNITILPFAKTFRVALFVMLWTSVMMGYIFHQNYLFMGGGIGYFSASWLDGVIGKIGTLSTLAFTGIGFLLVNNLVKVPSFAKTATVPEAEEAPAEPAEDERHDIEEPVLKKVSVKNELKDTPPPSTVEFNVEPELLVKEEKKTPPVKVDDSIEFSIEKAPEVETKTEEPEEEKKTSSSPYDPKLDLSSYKFPPLSILHEHGHDSINIDQAELTANKDRIVATLANYSIGIKKIKATPGPTVTLYEIVPQDEHPYI